MDVSRFITFIINLSKCGKNLFHKKGKPQLICHDESCGYTEPYTAPEKSEDGEES